MEEATKQWWGPRIWRILHCIAEVSDRSDCGLAWRAVLRSTAEILPCDVCRHHMQSSTAALRLVQPRSGADMRILIRHFLWSLHQASASVGISEESLSEFYGGDRASVLGSAREGAREVEEAFRRLHILDRFREGGLRAWVHDVNHLTHLLWMPEVVMVGRRGRR